MSTPKPTDGGAPPAARPLSLGLLNLGVQPRAPAREEAPPAPAEEKPASTLTVTAAAAAAIREQLARRGHGNEKSGLRVGVKSGGCSGLSYFMQFEDEPRPEDLVIEAGGVKVYVDPKSLAFLAGTELDFVKTLMKQGFEFRNPRQKSACGCGESFTV